MRNETDISRPDPISRELFVIQKEYKIIFASLLKGMILWNTIKGG